MEGPKDDVMSELNLEYPIMRFDCLLCTEDGPLVRRALTMIYMMAMDDAGTFSYIAIDRLTSSNALNEYTIVAKVDGSCLIALRDCEALVNVVATQLREFSIVTAKTIPSPVADIIITVRIASSRAPIPRTYLIIRRHDLRVHWQERTAIDGDITEASARNKRYTALRQACNDMLPSRIGDYRFEVNYTADERGDKIHWSLPIDAPLDVILLRHNLAQAFSDIIIDITIGVRTPPNAPKLHQVHVVFYIVPQDTMKRAVCIANTRTIVAYESTRNDKTWQLGSQSVPTSSVRPKVVKLDQVVPAPSSSLKRVREAEEHEESEQSSTPSSSTPVTPPIRQSTRTRSVTKKARVMRPTRKLMITPQKNIPVYDMIAAAEAASAMELSSDDQHNNELASPVEEKHEDDGGGLLRRLKSTFMST